MFVSIVDRGGNEGAVAALPTTRTSFRRWRDRRPLVCSGGRQGADCDPVRPVAWRAQTAAGELTLHCTRGQLLLPLDWPSLALFDAARARRAPPRLTAPI